MNIDINLAWRRVWKDIKDRHFISPLFLPDIIQKDVENWLNKLKTKIDIKAFFPHPMEIVDIPKGKGLIRPGSLLRIDDNVYYSALVSECYENILNRIGWSQNSVDFAYIITKEHLKSSEWYSQQLLGWNSFRERSLEKLKEGYQYVIETDITGFYENIDINILVSDLKACLINNEIIQELSKCLNRWSQVNNKGIPQGNSASDILAKLYLDNIDTGLKNAGYIHLRYVDDIRIFCKNSSEAKLALIELTRLLRKRGLNLQSSKTNMMNASTARIQIEGVQPVIGMVTESQPKKAFPFAIHHSYESEKTEESVEDKSPGSELSLESIINTFKTYFIDATDAEFDKTLFHFLINRLVFEKNTYALRYCLGILDIHPEETNYILKCSESFDDFDIEVFYEPQKMQNVLVNFLDSKEAVYDYQNFQIMKWFLENEFPIPDKLIDICRKFAFDNNRPYYLRSICRCLLGNHGNSADLDKIEDQLAYISSDLERAELLCCLIKMEKSKRNALFGRVLKDGEIARMSIAYIKSIAFD